MLSHRKKVFLGATAILASVVACGGSSEIAPPPETPATQITSAAIEALPRIALEDGSRLCISGTAADVRCPQLTAFGNWLGADFFAVWESNRRVQLYRDGTFAPLLTTDSTRDYVSALAVGPGASADEVQIIDLSANTLHRFRVDGKPLSASELPEMTNLDHWSYSGTHIFRQSMVTSADSVSADVVIHSATTLGDSTGRELFRAHMPQIHLRGGHVTAAPPYFPAVAVSAFDLSGAVTWSQGGTLSIEHDSPTGTPLWRLASDITGPPVDSSDIAVQRARIAAPGLLVPVPADQLDSMAVASIGTNHPAVTGILIAPSKVILIARSVTPQRDSIDYLRVSPDGALLDRFTLLKKWQPVLFGGDSLLVHRPAGTGKELVWVRLKK